jgi:hypothetical protein
MATASMAIGFVYDLNCVNSWSLPRLGPDDPDGSLIGVAFFLAYTDHGQHEDQDSGLA